MALLSPDLLLLVYVVVNLFAMFACSAISPKIQPVADESFLDVKSVSIRQSTRKFKTAGNELNSPDSLVNNPISASHILQTGEHPLNADTKEDAAVLYFHRLGKVKKNSFIQNSGRNSKLGEVINRRVVASSYDAHPRTARLAEKEVTSDSHQVSKMVLTVATTVAALFSTCMLVAIFQCCCRKKRSLQDDNESDEKTNRAQSYRQTDSRTEVNGKQPLLGNEEKDDESKSVSDKIKAFEGKQDDAVMREDNSRPTRKIQGSELFDKFEKEGIIIGMGRSPKKRLTDVEEVSDHHHSPGDKGSPVMGYRLPELSKGEEHESPHSPEKEKVSESQSVEIVDDNLLPDDDFSAVKRETEILRSYRKAGPPAKRRAKRKMNRAAQEDKDNLIASDDMIVGTEQTTVEIHITSAEIDSCAKEVVESEAKKSLMSSDVTSECVLSESKLNGSLSVLSGSDNNGNKPVNRSDSGSTKSVTRSDSDGNKSVSHSDSGSSKSVSRSDSGGSKSVTRSDSDSNRSVTRSDSGGSDVPIKQSDNDLTKHPNIFMQLDPTVQPSRIEVRKVQNTDSTDEDKVHKKKMLEKEEDISKTNL